jgi:predicted AlkP superfamily pyrophosphatase or phosphodiesterase
MEFLVGLVAAVCVIAFVTSGKINYIDQVLRYSDTHVDIYQWERTGEMLTAEEVRVYKKTSNQAFTIRGISSVILCFCLLYFFPG